MEVVSAYSWELTPSRERSLWYVRTPARSVTPITAESLFVGSALLVAVIDTDPADEGATKVAVVVVWLLNVPAVADHVTPALPRSLATAAVKGRD